MTQRLPSSADALLRINFAAQAAVLMATTLGSTASKSDDREADKVKRKRRKDEEPQASVDADETAAPVAASGNASSHDAGVRTARKEKKKTRRKKKPSALTERSTTSLSGFYGTVASGVAEKFVLRMDTDLKRSLCKHCKSPLIPGETARVRIRPRRERHLNITCLKCGHCRRLLTRPGHSLAYDLLPITRVPQSGADDESPKKDRIDDADATCTVDA